MKKNERLAEMAAVMIENVGRPVTRTYLASRLGLSIRTIYRYKRWLAMKAGYKLIGTPQGLVLKSLPSRTLVEAMLGENYLAQLNGGESILDQALAQRRVLFVRVKNTTRTYLIRPLLVLGATGDTGAILVGCTVDKRGGTANAMIKRFQIDKLRIDKWAAPGGSQVDPRLLGQLGREVQGLLKKNLTFAA